MRSKCFLSVSFLFVKHTLTKYNLFQLFGMPFPLCYNLNVTNGDKWNTTPTENEKKNCSHRVSQIRNSNYIHLFAYKIKNKILAYIVWSVAAVSMSSITNTCTLRLEHETKLFFYWNARTISTVLVYLTKTNEKLMWTICEFDD